mmetsp:Transcript_764/g.2028  ORF Transcript_764/g.2028 Transcript_764/m.2028 type:complete len:218 (+) Transcript_764:3-656(+)
MDRWGGSGPGGYDLQHQRRSLHSPATRPLGLVAPQANFHSPRVPAGKTNLQRHGVFERGKDGDGLPPGVRTGHVRSRASVSFGGATWLASRCVTKVGSIRKLAGTFFSTARYRHGRQGGGGERAQEAGEPAARGVRARLVGRRAAAGAPVRRASIRARQGQKGEDADAPGGRAGAEGRAGISLVEGRRHGHGGRRWQDAAAPGRGQRARRVRAAPRG